MPWSAPLCNQEGSAERGSTRSEPNRIALEPEQARFRLFDSIATFLKNAAQSQPLLLVLDDLPWVDQPSLLPLQFLAREKGGSRDEPWHRDTAALLPVGSETGAGDSRLWEVGSFPKGLEAIEGQPIEATTAELLLGIGRAQMATYQHGEAVTSLSRVFDLYTLAGDLDQAGNPHSRTVRPL